MGYNFHDEAQDYAQYLADFRHELHAHPELAFTEFWTTERIMNELKALGFEPKPFEPTGCMLDIKGNAPGGMVAFRADMDGLPVTEIPGRCWRSIDETKMHACGHDAHVSMLLGAARILDKNRDKFSGTVRCIFQPAEEIDAGAPKLISQGVGDNVDYFFGIHCNPGKAVGSVETKYDTITSAISQFVIKVNGLTAHGAKPEEGIDAGLVASEIYMALQSIVARKVKPQDTAVVTVGIIKAGTVYNSIPGYAELTGSCRFVNPDMEEKIPMWIRQVAEGVAAAHGATVDVEYTLLAPPGINDRKLTDLVVDCAKDIVGEDKIRFIETQMWSDDFPYYERLAPSTYFLLGSGLESGGLHTENMLVDDSMLPIGAEMISTIACKALEELKK